jgi:hypothetical protein
MLETAHLSILIRHDDARREFAYDEGAEQALAAADEHGWNVVSMKDVFTTVFEAADHGDARASAHR